MNVTSNAQIFSQYLNPWFIETGTNEGYGVACALEAGFDRIRSVELSRQLYDSCCAKFYCNRKVELLCGDSTELLPQMIADIHEPITFWLDAHHCFGWATAGQCGETPIIQELAVIGRHKIKSHAILIDDMTWFEGPRCGRVTQQQIRDAILAINPNYAFTYHTGVAQRRDDILAAVVNTGA